jgi:nitrate reductase NapAB chaperone NapD
MAQVCSVIQADPNTLATSLAALNREVLLVQKTSSAGKFIVISEAPSTSQVFAVISGDPEKLVLDLAAIVTAGRAIELVIPTFSASQYVVVSK